MAAGCMSQTDVDLWYAWIEALSDHALRERYVGLLSAEESEQVERLVFEADRRRGLMARALMRTALSTYTGLPPARLRFVRDRLGKPELAEPAGAGLSFNLSHAGELVVCAVARQGSVGVDVEELGRSLDFLPLGRRFFAPSETAVLERTPPEARRRAFFEIWTLKEAYAKARGLGLSIPLGSFAVIPAGEEPPSACFSDPSEDDPAEWRFGQVELAGRYQLAVALRSGGRGPLGVRLRETVPLVRAVPARILPPNGCNRWVVQV